VGRRVALQRPYSFVVLALLIAIFGALAALNTPTEILAAENYRSTVLRAMKEVQDELSSLRWLVQEYGAQGGRLAIALDTRELVADIGLMLALGRVDRAARTACETGLCALSRGIALEVLPRAASHHALIGVSPPC
jgi:hypothetical protein